MVKRSKQFLRTLATAVVVVVVMVLGSPVAAADRASTAAKPQPRLGMNLNGPADWNSELPFVDVFRLARPWVSQKKGERWGNGPTLTLDEHSWIKRLDSDCWAESPLCTIQGGHYRAVRGISAARRDRC